MSDHRYSLVSVVFESEVALQWLQARSVENFVDVGLFDDILVIDNSARGLRRAQRESLLEAYGRHRSRVRIVASSDIVEVPSTVGWMSQQVLKLAVARLVSTDRYLMLDAKNHFIAPLRRDFLEGADGRTRTNVHSYESHSLHGHLERTLRYMGVDPGPYLSRFTVTATPFVFDTEQVRALIDYLDDRSEDTFAEEFVKQGLTEFFLYSAWLLAQGISLDDFFELEQTPCPTVWPGTASVETLRDALHRADADGSPLFSVHRKALARFDDDAVGLLVDFWVARGLFDDSGQAHRFLQWHWRAYRLGETRRRMREAPHILRRRLEDRR